jgi:PEP-CTERM motif
VRRINTNRHPMMIRHITTTVTLALAAMGAQAAHIQHTGNAMSPLPGPAYVSTGLIISGGPHSLVARAENTFGTITAFQLLNASGVALTPSRDSFSALARGLEFDNLAIGTYTLRATATRYFSVTITADTTALTATPTPVPEPSAYALAVAGLAVIGMAGHRRRNVKRH